jgi:hypothetical protein
VTGAGGAPGRRHDRLDAEPVLATVQRLRSRIDARFGERGLRHVCDELAALVAEVGQVAPRAQRRLRASRVVARALAAVVVVATAVVLVLAVRSAFGDDGVERGVEWLPLLESTVNDVVFAGIAVYFLYTLPERLQRGSLLELLHRLRSLAHVVDMHQVSKDPERLRSRYEPTDASPEPDPTIRDAHDLERYLDYCSEMLSLVAKTAALCAEESRDAVVLETVGTIETLTSSMSQKIWQKIGLLDRA